LLNVFLSCEATEPTTLPRLGAEPPKFTPGSAARLERRAKRPEGEEGLSAADDSCPA